MSIICSNFVTDLNLLQKYYIFLTCANFLTKKIKKNDIKFVTRYLSAIYKMYYF